MHEKKSTTFFNFINCLDLNVYRDIPLLRLFCCSGLTVGTSAIKMRVVSLDLSREILRGQNIDMVKIDRFQIHHTAAVLADKMVVRRTVAVKPVRPDTCRNLLDFSKACQKGQIAVDGAKADVGVFHFHVFVNGFGGRMVISPDQKILDRLPLPAVF